MEKRDNNSSRIKPNLDLEIYYSQNYNIIAGVDEAGRGPWVGPVYSAAVILDQDNIPDGINDSKKTSPRKRKEIFNKIEKRFSSLSKKVIGFDTLSMGMSTDYGAAIQEGATMIRIGTGIFGPRK